MTFPWIMLLVQAVLGVLTLDVLRRRVLPNIDAEQDAIINVGLPFVVIIPMMFFVGLVQTTDESGHSRIVIEALWTPIGAPVLCGAFAVAIWMILPMPAPHRRGMPSPWTAGATPIAIWTLTGVTLLMLGAAHLMRLLVGQFIFAIAALLMWLNTPTAPQEPSVRGQRASSALLLATLLSVGHGVAVLLAGSEVASISTSLMVATGVLSLALIAAIVPGDAALRAGGWAATYGVLFGLGILSLVRLVPISFDVAQEQSIGPANFVVGRGFGVYAPEAIALLVLGGAAYAATQLPDRPRRILGAIALLGLAVGGAWRLVAL